METKTLTERKGKMSWYIVRAISNQEKSVSQKLTKEGENGDLKGKIGRVLVPLEKSMILKDGKKILKERVLFPGYIFIETSAIGELKFAIKQIKGATGFLTNRAGDIESLTNSEVEKMIGLDKENKEKDLNSGNSFIIGEEVKILDGPFATFIGTVDEINGEKIKVSVAIFGRKTPLDVTIYQIGKKN